MYHFLNFYFSLDFQVHIERVGFRNRKLSSPMVQINAADARLYAVEQLRQQPSLK